MRVLLAGEQTVHTIRLARELIGRGYSILAWEGERLCQRLQADYGLGCDTVRVPELVLRPRRLGFVRCFNERLRLYLLQKAAVRVRADVLHINYIWHE